MRTLPSGLCLAAVLALAASPAAVATEEEVYGQIEALHGDADAFGEAFGLLQDAMMFGDPVTVADLGAYPLTVAANGEVYDVLAPQDLVDNYDALLMPETQDLIANQDYADLFVNDEGVMFGEGELWMALVCEDKACAQASWRIIAINN